MPRNVEIKAAVPALTPVVDALSSLAHPAPETLVQEDTFFVCSAGRLKLRRLSPSRGELIHYVRADETGPKESCFTRVPTSEPDLLRDALARAYGTAGIVRKHRVVYLVGRTRVHLDQVEGLGSFVELEVVLDESESTDAAIREARALMIALGLRDDQLVSGAYVDLLRARAAPLSVPSCSSGTRAP